MKIYKLAAFVAIALISCSREPREGGGLVQHTITAGIEGSTKTELAADNDTQVQWSVGDQVDVWVEGTAYEFTSKVTESDTYSTFEGIAPADMDMRTWVLVYPGGASTGKDGNIVSATLPATQTARANGYDPSAALLYGASQGSGTTCRHLYSGIRLMLSQTGIRRVSLKGNAGEKIAGDFTFNCSDGTIGSGTSETIVLNAPNGGTFATGTWYYVLCLPAVFSRGITITADNGSQVGYFTTETSTTFTRSIIKNKEDLAIDNWADIGSAGTVHYGTANSLCLQAGSGTTIDVTPGLTTAGWQRSGLETSAGAAVPDGCEVLWGNATASIAAQKLTVSAAAAGSSLVAIKKGETILWSYLIWVTESAPAETTLPGGAVIQSTLGGNCYFQWGRKDPLLSSASRVENQGAGGLAYSISHPEEYIKHGNGQYDWIADNQGGIDWTLWGEGASKTVWDPCPAGYRIPSKDDFSGITDAFLTSHFEALGYIAENGYYNYTDYCYWTGSTDYMGDVRKLSWSVDGTEDDVLTTAYRYLAYPVRCVKEND